MVGVLDERSYQRLGSSSKTSFMRKTSIFLNVNDETERGRKSSFLPDGLVSRDPSRSQQKLANDHLTYCGAAYVTSFERNTHTLVTRFVTGSKYLGDWNSLGMTEKGVYRYPHGVVYDGHFNTNGEFHGTGILTYPNGQRLEGLWKNGKLAPGANFVTNEGNIYRNDYCKMPDRRFQIEIQKELQAADHENLTNSNNPVQIPTGCFDAGEGFYNPKLKIISSYNKTGKEKPVDRIFPLISEERTREYNLILKEIPKERLLRNLLMRWKVKDSHMIEAVPMQTKEEWIIRNCRHEPVEPVGYRPELYETWTTGAKKYNVEEQPEYFFGRRDAATSELLNISCRLSFASMDTKRSRVSFASLQALSTMFVKPIGAKNRIRFSSKPHKIKHSFRSRASTKQSNEVRMSKTVKV